MGLDRVILAAEAPGDDDDRDLICVEVDVEIAAAKDEKTPPRFSMLAYTGAKMTLAGWDMPVVIDLNGMSVPERAIPIFHNHYSDRIVGHADNVAVSNKDIRVAGVISGSGRWAREIAATSGRGFPWQASVGARALRVEMVEKGATAEVNGQSVDGPCYVARATKLSEVSFVAWGADDQTTAKVAAIRSHNRKEKIMFEKWLKAHGQDPDKLTDEEKAAQKLIYDAEIKASADDDADDKTADKDADIKASADKDAARKASADLPTVEEIVSEGRAKLAAEYARAADIQAVAADHPEIVAKAIRENWSKERAELEVLRMDRPKAPAFIEGRDGADQGVVLEAAMRLGSEEKAEIVEKAYPEKVLEAAYKHRRMGIRAFCEQALRLEGRAVPSLSDGPEIWAAAAFSTANVPGILGNTANKILVAAFGAVPSAAVRVGKKLSAKDFKTHTGYRIGAGTTMEVVGGAGELKHGDLTEASFTFYVDTYGEIIGISRKAWINDDLGAFTAIPMRIGAKAARTREKLFWDLVKANTGSFFSAANSNVSTSTGVDSAGYDKATQVMEEMTDDDGNEILVTPKLVVVPPALSGAARRMYRSQNLAVTGLGSTSAKKTEGGTNVYEGVYEPISVPHLRAGATPAGSDSTFYLFADPAQVAAFGIAYLNGVEAPTVEAAPLPSDCLGRAWRGYLDVGVCQVDEQGGVKCTA